MPSVQIVIHQASGEAIVLSPGDRLEKIVTIECISQRCASRNGLDKPKEISLTEDEPMPEGGDQWMSLILPERSPQFSPMPPNFCSPQCVKDFLVYQYLAPGPRQPEVPAVLDSATVAGVNATASFAAEEGQTSADIVRKTDNSLTPITDSLPEPLTMLDLEVERPVYVKADTNIEYSCISQADGFVEGENPRGPSIF